MWKVVVIVCALGWPCVIFEEEPKKYYQAEIPCIIVAEKKHKRLVEGFINYGYYIEYSQFKCNLDGPSLVGLK